jgi:hypothetical protein
MKKVQIMLDNSEMDDLYKIAKAKNIDVFVLTKNFVIRNILEHKNPHLDKNLEIRNLNNQIKEFKKQLEKLKQEKMEYADGLDEAADIILRVLETPMQRWIKEVASQVLHIPLWQLIAGHLRLAHDRGEIPGPALDPAWETAQINRDIRNKKTRCVNCSELFMPKQMSQVFCCNGCASAKNHSEDCEIRKREREFNLV